MGDMSCYTCGHSRIEASTNYMVCNRNPFLKYVTPCGVCDSYERGRYDKRKSIDDINEFEPEVEVEITVIENE